MKKIISMFCMVLLIGALAACGEPKKETATFTMEENGVKQTITMTAENDLVQRFTQVSEVDLSEYDETVTAEIEAAIAELEQQLEGYECTEYSYNMDDTKLVETIDIDMTNSEELKQLVDQGFIPISGGGDDMKISMKQSIEGLQSAGWTLVDGDSDGTASE